MTETPMNPAFRSQLSGLVPRLRRFGLGLTGRQDLADDLVQDACERALRSAGQWQEGTRMDSWLYRIMQNLWIDLLRGRARHGTELPTEALDDAASDIDLPDLESSVLAKLSLEDTLAAMKTLSPPLRVVLVLVSIEGQSYQEAATTLEVPVGTVMSRLARARQALRAALAEPAAVES